MINLYDAILLAFCYPMAVVIVALFVDKFIKYKRGY